MPDESTSSHMLRPRELEAVYAISSAVAKHVDIDTVLDEIINLTRPVFIFDNMVLYQVQESGALEPAYARVIGRGKSASGDLAWGEAIANDVFHLGHTQERVENVAGWEEDRLNSRYFLGLPLFSGEEVVGTLVFGRFGGPPYTPDQVHLSEFIASLIAQLLVRQRLVERVSNLEAERRLQRLQENFIATVSHELRTPLGFIKGYATTLLRDDTTWDVDTRREFLMIIDEEADRLRELIDNLLDSSRLQTGTLLMQFQLVRFDSLLKDIVQRATSRHDSLCVNLDVNSPLILQADPTRITQVFDNLINNSVKYAPGSEVDIQLFIEQSECHIIIRDHGPGIAQEHLEHLFERFYRVPNSGTAVHGTGLGLFICKEIILAHSGRIQVESTVGEGTTFHIYLPVTDRTPKQPYSGGSDE